MANRIEYMCRYCGQRNTRLVAMGRPLPGKCNKRPKVAGLPMPHSWVINRKI